MKKLYLYILIILFSSCTTIRLNIEPPTPTEKEHKVSNINKDNLFESGQVVIIEIIGGLHIYMGKVIAMLHLD